MSEAVLGYISGILASKGCLEKKSHRLFIETSDEVLKDICQKKLSMVFDIKTYTRIRRSKKDYETFLFYIKDTSFLEKFDLKIGRKHWNVPSYAFTSHEFGMNFLKALFDFSGTIKARKRNSGQKERSMKISSINENGLRSVKDLLDKYGIKSMIYQNRKNFVLEINGKHNLEMYLEKIGFENQKKKGTLEKILDPVKFDEFFNSH